MDVGKIRGTLFDEERVKYIASRAVGRPGPISPSEMRKYYEQKKKKCYQPERVQLRVIRLPFAENNGREGAINKAAELLKLFRNGKSFAQLAQEFSKERTAKQGGLWEIRELSSLTAPFKVAVAKLREGEKTATALTPSSIFIVKLEQYFPEGPLSFKEVRIEIKRRLEQDALRRMQNEWLINLYESATVRYVNPIVKKIIEEWKRQVEEETKAP